MQDSSSTFYKIQETPGVGLGLGLMLVPGGQVSCVCLCVSVCVQGWVLHVRYACIDMHVRMHARMLHARGCIHSTLLVRSEPVRCAIIRP
jgi:hypothetical protein